MIAGLLTLVILSSSFAIKPTQEPCEKALLKGVTYSQKTANGTIAKARLRFAPFELPSHHSGKFNQFKTGFERRYGFRQGPYGFEELVCRYYFGSYTFSPLLEDIPEIKSLLQRCPLKELTHIVRSNGPIQDCAPAAVHCEPPRPQPSVKIYDHIFCARESI